MDIYRVMFDAGNYTHAEIVVGQAVPQSELVATMLDEEKPARRLELFIMIGTVSLFYTRTFEW